MNIRQVRKKIRSISNVKKISKAMEMVSAIKMRKAQELEVSGRPYRDSLDRIIQRVLRDFEAQSSLLAVSRPDFAKEKNLIIVITSNKGLCGAFNINLLRYVVSALNVEASDFITVGKKGAAFLSKFKSNILADFSSGKPQFEVSAIFNLALQKFLAGEYSKVILAYTKFISTLRSEPVLIEILPAKLESSNEPAARLDENYLIEPAAAQIVDSLLRSYIEEKIRGAIISSEATEHSSRMIAMKNATENASDVIYSFTLLRNKLRQEKITGELLDMITAKESVESS